MKKLYNTIKKRTGLLYKKSSIQIILSLSFTAVAVLGMAFLGIGLFLRFSTSTNKQMQETSQQILSQSNITMDNYLKSMMQVSDTMYYSVIKDIDLSDENMDYELELLYEGNRGSIASISVFAENGMVVSSYPLATLKENIYPMEYTWFSEAMEKSENMHFSTPHVQNLFLDTNSSGSWVVSLSRKVQLTQDGAVRDGVLLVDMDFSSIAQICSNVDLPYGGYLYLIDSDGEVIYHPNQQLIYSDLLKENNLEAVNYSDGVHLEDFNGMSRQVTVKTVGYTGWKLVSVVETRNPLTDYNQILLFFLFMFFFSIFLLIFVNQYISERISVPIKNLDDAVKKLEKGAKDLDLRVQGPNEIQHLGHSIESMVSTLHHLMDDIIVQEKQKRRSELDVLHSQINPHFLYNTLDTVVWMNENGSIQDAITMVTSLARFFRISLSRGQTIISLADELEHARHYLTIQKMRYKNRFDVEFNIDDDVKDVYALKLIVQPILENAIYHGMTYADGDGLIIINARKENNNVIVDIIDNGPGMREEVSKKLLLPSYKNPNPKAGGSGIGLRNVHQRLRLNFGEPYGLTIISEPDEGTTVRITLPVVNSEDVKKYQTEALNET